MLNHTILLSLLLFVEIITSFIVFPSIIKKEEELHAEVDEIVLLHVIFRHGDRTRDVETYPTDPYINETFYPYGYGQLTNAGKMREYRIGEFLRKKYNKFLGDLYTPDVLDARSTDVNRTKMSLELVLASLYPPRGEQVWLPGVQWQPIPYNYWSSSEDHLLGNAFTNCPTFTRKLKEFMSTPEGYGIYQDDERLYNYLSKHTGLNVTDPFQVYDLFFALSTEEEWGLKLPQWTTEVWPKEITEAGSKVFYLYTGTKTLTKYSTGFFLKKIIDDTNAKIKGKLQPQDRKIFLYSGHERNIGQVLRTLGIYDRLHIPPYGSFVVFEVSRSKESYKMKVFYEDYRKQQPQIMKLPGCSELCDLRKFESLYYDILPTKEDSCYDT